jgi:hypothetical protein
MVVRAGRDFDRRGQSMLGETRRWGDESAGFELSVHPCRRLFRLRIYGFWTVALAEEYRKQSNEAMEPLDPTFSAVVDARDAKVQVPEVRAIRAGALNDGIKRGLTAIAYLSSTATTALQIRRLANEAGCQHFEIFNSDAEGVNWLASLDPKLDRALRLRW